MQMATTVLLALLFAYVLGEFPLQASRFAAKGDRWWTYLLHGGIHLALLTAALAIFVPLELVLNRRLAIFVSAYILVHLAIDVSKHVLISRKLVADSLFIFLTGQTLHLVNIVGVSVLISRLDWQAIQLMLTISETTKGTILVGGVVYTAVVFAGGYLIRYMTKGLLDPRQLPEPEQQLINAGLYIGWLERFLVVTAVVLRSPTLIGLILTGKSIARFPEMKEPKFAEYFLIGTLLSVSIGFLGGLLLLRLWQGSFSLQ